ncbi:hypothetical protein B0J13DRAFT_13771 [Dactylonectria estremocensis]|uniref:Uncharacterized protein n=1 Tax=Dactylonectria estremocensis TaxID=1079267 RepID=A0A9P9JKW9_9HYPO|nr:hypothetical protein B0J13DRAFT_13771 [Dactylonectria estremocensis]
MAHREACMLTETEACMLSCSSQICTLQPLCGVRRHNSSVWPPRCSASPTLVSTSPNSSFFWFTLSHFGLWLSPLEASSVCPSRVLLCPAQCCLLSAVCCLLRFLRAWSWLFLGWNESRSSPSPTASISAFTISVIAISIANIQVLALPAASCTYRALLCRTPSNQSYLSSLPAYLPPYLSAYERNLFASSCLCTYLPLYPPVQARPPPAARSNTASHPAVRARTLAPLLYTPTLSLRFAPSALLQSPSTYSLSHPA